MSFPVLGVTIVTYNSSDVIVDCLESLLAQVGVSLRVTVVDNGSTDDTVDLLHSWRQGTAVTGISDDLPFDVAPASKPFAFDVAEIGECGHSVSLIETGRNGGFAAGVNTGLAHLAQDPNIDRFWVLNPDGVAAPGTAQALASAPEPEGGFSLMGGRVLYCDGTDRIQIDGGTVNARTGVTGNVNLGAPASTPAPSPRDMDFITGASMVASRKFYETAGPMPEEYFLYYEEVDWAMRRGELPFLYCAQAVVYHRAGTAIGSPKLGRPASPFSLFFKHRARMMFIKRYHPHARLTALAYSFAKSGQLLLKGFLPEAYTLLTASLGFGPMRDIRKRLSPDALRVLGLK